MSRIVSHAERARNAQTEAVTARNSNDYLEANFMARLAQSAATLALVEQQRIANLIALGQFRVGVNDLPHLRHLAVAPDGEFNLQPVAEIREALGLS